MAPRDRPAPIVTHLPGVLHVLLFTAAAYTLYPFTGTYGVGRAALGVVLGVVAGNIYPVEGTRFDPGVRFVGKRILALAVVLLGLRVTVGDILGLGLRAGAVVLVTVSAAVLVALLLGRLIGIPRPLAALIGVGTGVCGVSAIAAVREATGADDRDVSYAVATITFLGSVGLLVYPALQIAFHPLGDTDFGIWAGATLHSVPQAVGAGLAGGGFEGAAAATVVKLSRVALLAPVAVLVALAFRRREDLRAEQGRWVPIEVTGFLALFVLGSLIAIPAPVLEAVGELDRFFLVAALTALGLQTRFRDLATAGASPFLVALATWGAIFAGVLVGLRLTA